MQKNPFLIVSNWKTYVSLMEGITYLQSYITIWEKIACEHNKKIILSPPLITLTEAQKLLINTPHIALCAQTCSPFTGGPHTGDIDTQSLKQLGCHYVIIGHPEQRLTYNIGNDTIKEQLKRVQEQNIIPILCIGENKKINSTEQLHTILFEQLHPIKEILNPTYPIIIAYEPTWLINTDTIPTLENIALAIKEIATQLSNYHNINILYGGNVSAALIPYLYTIPSCAGALVGRASLSFESFKNILSASKI